MSSITLRQLRAFAATASEGSFTRAAQIMHITQSGVSVLVRDLETLLETSLLNRTTRRVELTDEGKAFMPHAMRMLSELTTGIAAIARLQGKNTRDLRLAVPQLVAASSLQPILQSFRRRHPEIHVQVTDSAGGLDALNARSVDVAITLDAMNEATCLVSELILGTTFCIVCRRDDVRMYGGMSWSQLGQHNLIWYDAPFTQRVRARLVQSDEQLQSDGLATFPHFLTALAMVSAGFGIAILPSYARSLVKMQGLEMIALSEPPMETALYVWSRRELCPPAVRSFVALLRESASASVQSALGRRPSRSALSETKV